MKAVESPQRLGRREAVTARGCTAAPADGQAQQSFVIVEQVQRPLLQWFIKGIQKHLLADGHRQLEEAVPDLRLVLNVVDAQNPVTFRRKAQATFINTICELAARPAEPIRTGYPILVRSLANLVIMLFRDGERVEAEFITPEQGHYSVISEPGADEAFFTRCYERIAPLAHSQLVINNVFNPDLEEALWEGDELTEQIHRAGKVMDSLDLLPAPFPIHELLDERAMRHVQRLYGLGGLSYGNLSARKDGMRFWMSASGVNKANLRIVGQDILMVTGYDAAEAAIHLSVPPNVQPRRVSVDAIEHWMIYQEHPEVGAIVHAHAWMEGIRCTEINYPCGTVQLAESVAQLVREDPNPGRAVIGLKNHGVTITGASMDEIFQRIDGKLLRQVPMS